MRIGLLTTCKGRVEHLRETLPQNLADNLDYPDLVFVVLSYGDRSGLAEFMRSPAILPHIESGRVVFYDYPTPERFAMAHSKNLSHRCGLLERADLLVNLDADNFTGPGSARWLADAASEAGPDCFFWTAKTRGISRGVSGRIAVTPRQFLCAGGYDERISSWGRDDKDVHQRLVRLGFTGIQIPPRFALALDHSDELRFSEYPACERDWRKMQANPEPVRVVNWGRVGVGEVYRNFGADPIPLGPLPTRIFGIGLHKTATTSLDLALRMLGVDSAHWLSHDWAAAIWREMTSAAGTSPTLERHYALSDLPIPLLYRQLDRAYPGSKFILTVRSEEAWLQSVEAHFSPRRHPDWRHWGQHPFPALIHRELYGRADFDRETFLLRYRRHYWEVRKYFEGREEDLLVLDMERNASWEKLCHFLGKPIPSQPYPRENQANGNGK